MADAVDLKSTIRKGVGVRVPLVVPTWSCSSEVERLPEEQGVGGSIPSGTTKKEYGRLIQWLECMPDKHNVDGSIPSPPTRHDVIAQLVSAQL